MTNKVIKPSMPPKPKSSNHNGQLIVHLPDLNNLRRTSPLITLTTVTLLLGNRSRICTPAICLACRKAYAILTSIPTQLAPINALSVDTTPSQGEKLDFMITRLPANPSELAIIHRPWVETCAGVAVAVWNDSRIPLSESNGI